MKKLSCFISLLMFISNALFAQVGINTDNSAPDPSAMLDVKSTSRGMLVPRMTVTERDNISQPATGLLVFCTDNNQYYTNKGTPVSPNWLMISSQWISNGSHIFYTGGRVGIGVSDPTANLDIRGGNADDGAILQIGNSDMSHRLLIYGGRESDPNPCLFWKQGDFFSFATDEGGGLRK